MSYFSHIKKKLPEVRQVWGNFPAMTNNSSAVRGARMVAIWCSFGGCLLAVWWLVALYLVGFLNKLE